MKNPEILVRWPENSAGVREVLCGEALNFSPGDPVDFFGSFLYQERNEQQTGFVLSHILQRVHHIQREYILCTVRVLLLYFLFFLCSLSSSAQSPLFSQYRVAPNATLNPAWAAASPDWWVVAHYRRQNLDGGNTFRSSQFSATRPLLWGKQRYGGVGISVLDDRAGEAGWYRFQRLGASLAQDIALTRQQRLSLGFNANYQVKRISTENIRTGSQFRPGQGFDPALTSGENMNDLQANYLSLGTGLLWYAVDRDQATIFYTGISWLDFNRPDESFFGSVQPLPSTLTVQNGFRAYQKNRFSVFPEFLLVYQAGATLLNVGSRFSYELRNAFSANTTNPRVDLITRYMLNRNLVLTLQWHQPSYTLGVSFDTEASIRPANPLQNAFEVALAWHQPVKPKDKPQWNRRRKKRNRRDRSKSKISVRIPRLASIPPNSPVDSLGKLPEVSTVTSPLVSIPKGKITTSSLDLIVEFSFNQTLVNSDSENSLATIAQFLRQHPNLVVTLAGHTDNVGNDEANQRLSLARARAVQRLLLEQQVASERIRIEGKGESEPLYPNTDEVLRAKNRRVEISFSR
ncbi:MAG: PorP/SprF family type IX secretion system membrane protein [Bacteroidota bacterium]